MYAHFYIYQQICLLKMFLFCFLFQIKCVEIAQQADLKIVIQIL